MLQRFLSLGKHKPGVGNFNFVRCHNNHAHGGAKKPAPTKRRLEVNGVSHIIAVASGKGGVGKSTVAVNLALGLARIPNLRIGLLDADIYGPSIPKMMNLNAEPYLDPDTKMMEPLVNYGIKTMSMGNLVPEDSPMIWRGPMVMTALNQLLRQVKWGELDVLVLDMPPGTGDAQLTISQDAPLSGAVIVSTPQDIALLDAVRGTNMFKTVNVPILGVVENMSYHICRSCGHTEHIFGHGGARQTAAKLGLDFLGEIPLEAQIRLQGDQGAPIVVSHPDAAVSKSYCEIAIKVYNKLKDSKPAQPSFSIKVEN
eukprot:TRINITY_DN14498_c0_g1_i1.p1 TRINITY_DN14498_c0_g1~~TRINITY_DN14498_c0_g1_i1.p1  ORF type:complete len:312 (+),score=59.64 TRINITY_DN14498_c0_g1_i1:45-980(+)